MLEDAREFDRLCASARDGCHALREELGARSAGGLRSAHMGSRLERLRRHLADNGVSRLGELTGMDRLGIEIVYSVRPAAVHTTSIVSQGKGETRKGAYLSAIGETIERLWSERVPRGAFAARLDWVRANAPADIAVCDPGWDVDEAIVWVPAITLPSPTPAICPAKLAVYPSSVVGPGAVSLGSDTTGLAFGATFAEALLHASLERVERRAVLFDDPVSWPRLDLEGLGEGVHRLLAAYRRAGVRMEVRARPPADGRRLCVVYAAALDLEWPLRHLFCGGSAASASVDAAVCGALLEVAQSRSAMISMLHDDVPYRVVPTLEEDVRALERVEEAWFMRPVPVIRASAFREARSFGEAWAAVCSELRGAEGTDWYGVDLTVEPDLGAVARTVAWPPQTIGHPTIRVDSRSGERRAP